jgi:peptidyl-prolyl cis-trans isomerase D
MLSAVRRSVRTWAAAAILFFALVAIVITGFGTGGFGGLGSLSSKGGNQGDVLASVGNQKLNDQDLSNVLNRQFTLARQSQPELGMAEYVAEAFDPILEQMILALAVQKYGQDRGLIVSDRMVDSEIVNIQAFQDAAGRFDETAFRRALQAQNMSEAQLRQDIGRSLMQRQLLGPIARGSFVPQSITRTYADLLFERRRGSIGVVPAAALQAGINPTPQEIANFYRQNQARFTIPERRVIKYAMVGPEQVAAQTRATDQEIAAAYRQNAATYGPRETRDLQSIVLTDQAAANRFAQAARGGANFAQAAQQAGFSASDISSTGQTRQTFAQTTSPQVSQAAFGAAQGAMVGPIRSPLGFHFVRVERINRTPARSLESVRAEIAAAIEQRKQADALNNLATRIEDKISDGASMEEIAQSEHLTLVTTPPVTSTGQSPGQAFSVAAEMQPMLRAAFDIDADNPEPVLDPLQNSQRFVLVNVERTIPAAPPPLAQIQAQVREALVTQRALERARTIANQIADRINHGMAPAQAFAQAGVSLPPLQNVDMRRLEINQARGQVSAPQLTLFALPQGRARAIPAGANGFFVVYHQQRTAGDASQDPNAVAAMGRSLTNSAPEEMAQQFARAIEQSTGVERNQDNIRRLKERLLGNALGE